MKEEIQCEAKYGDKQCTAKATTSVVSSGMLFDLCKGCARAAKKQVESNK